MLPVGQGGALGDEVDAEPLNRLLSLARVRTGWRYPQGSRHRGEMRIKLELDDGVKVNYGKFGDPSG